MSHRYKLCRLRDEQGFTVLELLVVILIIGVLAGIALPRFMDQRGVAWDAAGWVDERNSVTVLTQILNDYSAVDLDSVIIYGYSAGNPSGKAVLTIQAGASVYGHIDDQTWDKQYEVLLSPGTRGAVAGTARHFTVCYWNPHGDVFSHPDTAWVWDSADGTFRGAEPHDDCVEAAVYNGEPLSSDDPPGGSETETPTGPVHPL